MGSDWVKTQVLGKGSQGTVYKAVPRHPTSSSLGSTIAIKSVNSKLSNSLRREANILHLLRDCPGIVRCYGEDINDEGEQRVSYSVLLEWAPDGSLKSFMRRYGGGKLPESDVRRYSRMILEALKYVHEKGYVHNDIKSSNILVFPAKDGDMYCVKLADFGAAKKVPDELQSRNDRCGLREEVADIWDFGCMVVEIMSGESTWEFRDLRSKVLENVSHEGWDFVMKCLDHRSNYRWTAEMLLRHPFVLGELKELVDNDETPLLMGAMIVGGFLDSPCLEFQKRPTSAVARALHYN